jgi:hypothetical protein
MLTQIDAASKHLLYLMAGGGLRNAQYDLGQDGIDW